MGWGGWAGLGGWIEFDMQRPDELSVDEGLSEARARARTRFGAGVRCGEVGIDDVVVESAHKLGRELEARLGELPRAEAQDERRRHPADCGQIEKG